MRIRVLGAHNSSSTNTAPVSILIDDTVCVDAGAVHTRLTLEEQRGVRAVLVTHRHFDHIHGIPLLAMNTIGHGLTRIYGLEPVIVELRNHFINGTIYPTFLPAGNSRLASLELCAIDAFEEFEVEGYSVLAVPVEHGVPAVGYQVRSTDNKTMFYTGDTGGALTSIWDHISPDVLFCEVTNPNGIGGGANHMSPSDFEAELRVYLKQNRTPFRVVTVHMTPWYEPTIRDELGEVSQRLGIDIEMAYEGMVIDV